MSDRTLDIRGIKAIPGDLVCVGETHGSSGGWLAVRKVVDVRDGKVFMESSGRTYPYRAASGFLILPESYKDALGKHR